MGARRLQRQLPPQRAARLKYIPLARTPDVRIREQRGRSVTWRLESVPVPGAATRPDAVTRFPVTRLWFDIHYGAETPAAVGLIVAAEAGDSANP
jgi:hypothetical protein